MRLSRDSRAASSLDASFRRSEPEHALRIAVADALLVGRRKPKRLDDRDGRADVAGALFLVERAVGSKQHMVGAEKVETADGGGAGALDRGVAVEVLEIVVRSLLQFLQQRPIVLVRGARAQLIKAVSHAALEIRNDA